MGDPKLVGAYAELEALLRKVWDTGRVPGTFTFAWDLVVHDLPLAECEAWCKARPASPVALACRGRAYVGAAWDARGGGWGNTVSAASFRRFEELLLLAKADLEAAVAADPKCPEAARTLITVAMGLGLPRSQARAYLRQAVAARADDLQAYMAMHQYLLPRWHGSEGTALAFADECIAARPDEPAVGLLLVRAHLDQAVYTVQVDRSNPSASGADRYLSRGDVRKEVEDALGRILARYPRAAPLLEAERRELAAVTGNRRWLSPLAVEVDDEASYLNPWDFTGQERRFWNLLREKRYRELEDRLAELWGAGRRKETFQLYWYKVTKDPELADLDAWCAARPESDAAFALRGTGYLERAWNLRGARSGSVAPEQARTFEAQLRLAKADLDRAVTLTSRCPRAHRSLIRVATGLRLPRADAEGYLKKAVAACPDDLQPYWYMSEYLEARSCGAPGDTFRFAKASMAARPDETALRRLVVLAHIDFAGWGCHADPARPVEAAAVAYLAQPKVRQEIEGAFAAIMARYPRAIAWIRQDCGALAALGDRSWLAYSEAANAPGLAEAIAEAAAAGPAAPRDPAPPAAPAPSAPARFATPEAWYAAMLDAIRKGDYRAFERLHTKRVAEDVTRDDFAMLVGRIAELVPLGTFKEGAAGVKVRSPQGRPLTTLKKVGDEWQADEVVGALR